MSRHTNYVHCDINTSHRASQQTRLTVSLHVQPMTRVLLVSVERLNYTMRKALGGQ